MRLILSLLMILLTGCSVMGHGARTACKTPRCNTPGDCPPTCEGSAVCNTKSSCGHDNWFCAHGWCMHGRSSHYKRIPDNISTKSGARKAAQAGLRQEGHEQRLSCDYRLGYEQAFVDVSLGACGDVPALPPANYWKSCARSPEGHQKAQQWFSGYAAGAARAKALYEPFNQVAHSQFDCPDREGFSQGGGNPGMY